MFIFNKPWDTGEISEEQTSINDVPIFQRGNQDDSGKYKPVSLTSIWGRLIKKANIIFKR